jgi:hypothetical protein
LQELVNAAVELCGADSAGISLEKTDRTETEFYHWVATADQYSEFPNALLPRYPSACGVCLERGRPQLFRVGLRFFGSALALEPAARPLPKPSSETIIRQAWLLVTFFESTSQLPPFDDCSMKGRTYRYFNGTPLYPFGYGLSYSRFHIATAPSPPASYKPENRSKPALW